MDKIETDFNNEHNQNISPIVEKSHTEMPFIQRFCVIDPEDAWYYRL